MVRAASNVIAAAPARRKKIDDTVIKSGEFLNNEMGKMDKELSDTQPNPGWGFICATCKHTFDDSEKYVNYPPEHPCKRIQYDRGGYDRSVHPPEYITPAPIFKLKRYVDDSESCPDYEEGDSDD